MSFEYKRYTGLYTATVTDIINGVPLIVHEGGSSSSKTYSIMQGWGAITFADPGCVVTVAGQDIPNLKKGPIRDFKNILSDEPLMASKFSYNKSDRIFTNLETESIIEFNSYDDEQDAKSGRRDYSFFNEANGIPFEIFDAIRLRTKKTSVIDFNPNARFWCHDRILPDTENRKWYKSNFRHNPFIDQKILNDILSYEPTPENIARGTSNEYKWKVYGLGEVGRLEGLVFPDWQVARMPEEYKWRVFGMDFGYTNDPTTLIEIRYKADGLYWKEHIYETGMTNPDIAKRLNVIGHDRHEVIVADSAEPKSIEEIKRAGWYIKGAEKGKDSVNQGIDAIKRYNVYIDPSSKNLIEEFSSYTWKKDKNGNPLNKPVDDYNHGIDAGRYGLTRKILRPQFMYV
jgi:phage terminase large subunit